MRKEERDKKSKKKSSYFLRFGCSWLVGKWADGGLLSEMPNYGVLASLGGYLCFITELFFFVACASSLFAFFRLSIWKSVRGEAKEGHEGAGEKQGLGRIDGGTGKWS